MNSIDNKESNDIITKETKAVKNPKKVLKSFKSEYNNNKNDHNKKEKNNAIKSSFFLFPSLISPIHPIQIKNNDRISIIRSPTLITTTNFNPIYLDSDLYFRIEKHIKEGKKLKCHNKDCNDKEYLTLEEYNNHCHNNHPKQSLHPALSLIKLLGLEERGNPWE